MFRKVELYDKNMAMDAQLYGEEYSLKPYLTAYADEDLDYDDESYRHLQILEVISSDDSQKMFGRLPEFGDILNVEPEYVKQLPLTREEEKREKELLTKYNEYRESAVFIVSASFFSDEPSYYDWDGEKQHPKWDAIENVEYTLPADIKTFDDVDKWMLKNHPDYYMGYSASQNIVSGNFRMSAVPCSEYPTGRYENLENRRRYAAEKAKEIGVKLGPWEHDENGKRFEFVKVEVMDSIDDHDIYEIREGVSRYDSEHFSKIPDDIDNAMYAPVVTLYGIKDDEHSDDKYTALYSVKVQYLGGNFFTHKHLQPDELSRYPMVGDNICIDRNICRESAVTDADEYYMCVKAYAREEKSIEIEKKNNSGEHGEYKHRSDIKLKGGNPGLDENGEPLVFKKIQLLDSLDKDEVEKAKGLSPEDLERAAAGEKVPCAELYVRERTDMATDKACVFDVVYADSVEGIDRIKHFGASEGFVSNNTLEIDRALFREIPFDGRIRLANEYDTMRENGVFNDEVIPRKLIVVREEKEREMRALNDDNRQLKREREEEKSPVQKIEPESHLDENYIIVWQRGRDDELNFMSSKYLKERGIKLNRDDYNPVYVGDYDKEKSLDDYYSMFQKDSKDFPEGYEGHSLSVGDILTVNKNGSEKSYSVEPTGFEEVPGFNDGRFLVNGMIHDTAHMTKEEIDRFEDMYGLDLDGNAKIGKGALEEDVMERDSDGNGVSDKTDEFIRSQKKAASRDDDEDDMFVR